MPRPLPIPTRRGFLGGSLALLAGASALGGGTAGARRLIVVYAEGGWDPSYTLDSKLGSRVVEGPEVDAGSGPRDVDELATFGNLDVVVNDVRRPQVATFFERWHHASVVVNGVFSGAIGHELGVNRVLTGTDDPHRPDVTVMFGNAAGAACPAAAIDFSRYQRAGAHAVSTLRLARGDLVETLVDPYGRAPAGTPDRTYPLWVPGRDHQDALDAYVAARAAQLGGTGEGSVERQLRDAVEANDRARQLAEVSEGVTLSVDGSIQQQLLRGAELLDRGVTRSVLTSMGGFDTHYNTADQNGLQDRLFGALDTLLADLEARGLLDSTLVLVTSEMGRSPRRNAHGGKDHWPHTSMLLLGGGVQGDRMLGATDDTLQSLPVDLDSGEPDDRGELLRPDSLLAGVLLACEVDPEPWLPGVRPWAALLA